MQLLYTIQVHKDCDQVLALLDLIYDRANAYVVSIDPFADLDESRIRRILRRTGRVRDIIYGGPCRSRGAAIRRSSPGLIP